MALPRKDQKSLKSSYAVLVRTQLLHLSLRTRTRTWWNKVPRGWGQHEDTRYPSLWGTSTNIFEYTCAYARWTLMHHFASVCLGLWELCCALPQWYKTMLCTTYLRQTWARSRFASGFGFTKPKLLRQKLRFGFGFMTLQKASASWFTKNQSFRPGFMVKTVKASGFKTWDRTSVNFKTV